MVKQLGALGSKAMFVELIGEGSTPTTPVTTANLNAWLNGLRVPFTSAYDADPASFTVRSTYGIKETTYIVERTTMKIVAKTKTPEDGLTSLAALP